MIRLPDKSLPPGVQTWLKDYQKIVDDGPTYNQQVQQATQLFEAKRRSAGFRPIINALKQMCSGVQRCCYCEDSQATDVEHIWPKNFYPDLVFHWENYLYACARCNRPKLNKCEIYSHSDGARLDVAPLVKQHNQRPPGGDSVLINPRHENPLEFIILEMQDTFRFLPHPRQGVREKERAEHTIKLLKLNETDVLPEARKEAYWAYRDRLKRYVDQKSRGESLEMLQRTVASLRHMGHPTVWHEMKRQRSFPHHQEIAQLFTAAPEALDW